MNFTLIITSSVISLLLRMLKSRFDKKKILQEFTQYKKPHMNDWCVCHYTTMVSFEPILSVLL